MVENQNTAVLGNILGKTAVFGLKLHIFLQKRKISDKKRPLICFHVPIKYKNTTKKEQ